MKKILLAFFMVLTFATLTACNLLEQSVDDFKALFEGRSATIQTYDEESSVIDRIHGGSIDIKPDEKFGITDSEGNTVEKSAVLNVTIGGHEMLHVGSSLIMKEDGLTDIFDEYAKTVDFKNNERSTPILNRMVNNYKNLTTGKAKIILIRSQSGKPLATFAGNKVSYFATDIDKSTVLRIDGKYLFIYRCDYSIYDKALLENQDK